MNYVQPIEAVGAEQYTGPYMDTLSRTGAETLLWRIARYWELRGYPVQMRLERIMVKGDGVWVVRSDMLNGKPRK